MTQIYGAWASHSCDKVAQGTTITIPLRLRTDFIEFHAQWPGYSPTITLLSILELRDHFLGSPRTG